MIRHSFEISIIIIINKTISLTFVLQGVNTNEEVPVVTPYEHCLKYH